MTSKIQWFKNLDTRKKVILIYFIIAFFYAVIIGIALQDWFNTQNPITQFILGTVPVFLLFSIVLGGTKNYRRMIASLLFFIAADTIVLGSSASNTFLTTIVSSFGLTGIALDMVTSVVLPTIFVAIAVFLLNKKEVRNEFEN